MTSAVDRHPLLNPLARVDQPVTTPTLQRTPAGHRMRPPFSRRAVPWPWTNGRPVNVCLAIKTSQDGGDVAGSAAKT